MNTRTLTTIRVISGAIALIGAAASYRTQILDLLRWGVDHPSAIAIPATVDLLGIICALVLHTPGVDPAGRKVAGWVLALTCTVSMTANGLGGDTWGSRVAHIWCVVAYLAAEAVSAKAHAEAATVDPQIAMLREQLAAAEAARDTAMAEAAQARADATRKVRAAKAETRKAQREATTVPAQPAAQAAPAPSAMGLWLPNSPADLEGVYLAAAPVSPAPLG